MIGARCRLCGGQGRLKVYKPYADSPVQYCVACTSCKEHTEHADSVEGAVRNWTDGVYSAETLMMRRPLPKGEDMDNDGVIRLCSALAELLRTDVIKAYMSFKKCREWMTAHEVMAAEKRFRSSFIMSPFDVDTDHALRKMRKEHGVDILDVIEVLERGKE